MTRALNCGPTLLVKSDKCRTTGFKLDAPAAAGQTQSSPD